MNDETRRSVELLLAALVVALLHLAYSSGLFAPPQGKGGVTLLLGFTLTTGLLWWMLAIRALANDVPLADQVPYGWAAMAATAAVFALLPPRAGNFLPVATVDDFTRLYLPVSLSSVFAMLLSRAVLKSAPVWRHFSFTCGCLGLLSAGLLLAAGGEDAGSLAHRAAVTGLLALAAGALRRR